MKLLLLTDAYLPHAGGSVRVVLETSRRLQERGHQVRIETFERDASLAKVDEVAGVPVRRIPLRGRLSTYPRALVAGRKAIDQAMVDSNYDLMHIHLPLLGLPAALSAKARGVPKIYAYYGAWHLEMGTELRAKPLPGPLRSIYRLYVNGLCQGLKLWQQAVMRRCHLIIVLSEHSRREIATSFPSVNQDRLVLIPGGVDIQRFTPGSRKSEIRHRLGLEENTTILLTVRRLVPRMGLENLLHAFAQIASERADLYLVIGGTGRLASDLSTLANELGIADRIRFAGFIPEADLPAYYQAADLFVLPTLALEGFGLITLEALASGLPVVGTPVGAIPEVLPRLDARFLAPGTSPEELAQGIRRGLAIVQEEGPGLSERCRAIAVQHYDWERIVDRYEALYAELLESPVAS